LKLKKVNIFVVVFLILGIVVLGFITLPLLVMFFKTSPKEIFALFKDPEVMGSIFLTFRSALFATFFAIVFGTPLSFLVARKNFWGKKIVEAIIDIPIMVPHTAAGIGLLVVFGGGHISNFFKLFGISFVGTEWGIVLAMAFVSIPFYLSSVRDGFLSIDKNIEYVAKSLGASQLQVFFRVMLPLSLRWILSGTLLMWGRGISEFGAVVVLAYHPMVAPVLIYDRFTSYGLKSSRPVAVLLILMFLAIFLLIKIFSEIWIKKRAEN